MNRFLIKCMFHIYQWHRKYGIDEDECKSKARLTFIMTLFGYPAFIYFSLKGIFHFETTVDMKINEDRLNNYKIISIFYALPYTIVGFTYWLVNRKKLNNLWHQYVNGEIELTRKDKIHSRIFYLGVLFFFSLVIATLLFNPPKIN